MAKLSLTQLPSWHALQAHYKDVSACHMREWFRSDNDRFELFSLHQGQLLLDYSKNRINQQTMDLLITLARETGVNQAIKAMFSGEKINHSQNRAVLHVALRNIATSPIKVDQSDVMPDVTRVLDQMENFCDQVSSGQWRGYTGKRIKHVINIGIGGSDLGPQMVIHALKPYWQGCFEPHFVANVDASDVNDTLSRIDPETSLFMVASKSFTTIETMANAHAARQWFLAARGASEDDIHKHFVAVTSNEKRALEFGIAKQNMFEFWEWVGGRYSLWSAIGLPIALMIGMDNFRALLGGAHEMDQHFYHAPFERNMPVIMAVLGVWYRDFFDAPSYAILPYDHYLRKLPAYLQQSDMESNGKNVTIMGDDVDCHTGPVIWGAAGVNGQHAFYQLMHQGTQLIPADFIIPINSHHHLETQYGCHHQLLLSNCLAQAEALMWGREKHKVQLDCIDNPAHEPHRQFKGNRPSNTLIIEKITPHNLGALIALYEHKIFVQGVIWNINSFDQWGVELGKKLSTEIESELSIGGATSNHDSSTLALIKHIHDRLES